jgi:hypothetical protein
MEFLCKKFAITSHHHSEHPLEFRASEGLFLVGLTFGLLWSKHAPSPKRAKKITQTGQKDRRKMTVRLDTIINLAKQQFKEAIEKKQRHELRP